MNYIIWLEKNGFLLMLLFCLGMSTPDFASKVSLMDLDLDIREDKETGSNSFKQIFWVSLFLFFACRYIFTDKMYIFRQRTKNKLFLLILLCSIALVSTSWSDYPSFTMKRSLFQFIYCTSIAMAFCFVVYHDNFEKTLKLALYTCVGLIVATVIFGAGFDDNMNLAGYTNSKNTLGINLAVLLILTHMLMKTFNMKSRELKLLLILAFVLLLFTQSKTSIALVLIYLLITRLSLFKINVAVIFLSSVFFLIFVLIPGVSYYLHDYKHIALYVEPDFLTGRGIIWDALYYDLYFFDKMALGYGYGSYFEVGVIPFVLDDAYSFIRNINSAHNGYLQLLLQFGVLGSLVIFFILVITTFNTKALYVTGGLVVPIIHNVTEASLFRDANMVWFFMIIIIMSSAITTHKRQVLSVHTNSNYN